ncbi:MAG: tRNA (adenosine(37)-N6)-dimethylallyltransferase MiaA [Acidobacteria bacterium]|nr:tRNA (adenosine(37)-N6)-dimethylallyltransferase MiaA [Acidobacteriota bacterium]
MAPVAAPLIAVVGPTAAGKSALALDFARAHGGEIVSCDSLQVYRGLDIGSAKPTAEERALVRHHLLDVVDPHEDFSAAEYARRGREALADVRRRGALPLVVGGTGLYLRALLYGLFEGPSRDEVFRQRLEALAGRFGDARLHRLLARVDAEAAGRVAPRDRVRVVRALEVFRATGRTLSAHHGDGATPLEGYETLILGIDPGRDALRQAVERRTDAMLGRGLLDEVRGLLARGLSPDSRPLRAIGYRQAVEVVLGRRGEADARHDIVTETMRYAKRQRTWFRHQARVTWCGSAEEARALAVTWLERAREAR